jgi:PTS system fructose-specific IIB component
MMKIAAITSCATGIAHSYMAAEAIVKTAKKAGHQAKVEIQGAMGVENALSNADIQNADIIVFANDVGITKSERFIEYEDKIIRTNPHEVIQHPELILEKASNLIKGR